MICSGLLLTCNLLTQIAATGTYVVDENFCSDRQPYYHDAKASFEENLTLIPAYRLVDAGKKSAVLKEYENEKL